MFKHKLIQVDKEISLDEECFYNNGMEMRTLFVFDSNLENKFKITLNENDNTVYEQTFTVTDNLYTDVPTINTIHISLIEADIVDNKLNLTFVGNFIRPGTYTENGIYKKLPQYESIDDKGAYDYVKKETECQRVGIGYPLHEHVMFLDEEGLFKPLYKNVTFTNVVGNVVIMKKTD